MIGDGQFTQDSRRDPGRLKSGIEQGDHVVEPLAQKFGTLNSSNPSCNCFPDEGSDAFAASLHILVNEAMCAERSAVLRAQPFERPEARTGYAKGFKPKTLTTRLGPITFAIPQVRGDLDFYPSALEKGVRSEQALKLALAEPSGAR